ncbi:hypothetical protein RA28_20660 [Ruegeria sp. ANG-S4]|uniref:non-ribosomal peptide synthetase n=1 Tax=Ruegeria sp. ANG-S4 TaxID=1577904 RepID=UPI00057CAE8E|nr:non-ribosomal peptide synthetase [Ruegeria sp. ANG-S4]KIC41794.1 hypothetical protein RA28_20660 [Ruegeria sp. ANG-S4]
MGHPKGVADILPLTSAQKGMLFHAVQRRGTPGAYVAVVSCAVDGPLEPERLKAAIQSVIEARDAFRAGFVWEGTKQPVQVVRERADLPWTELDWRDEPNVKDKLRDLEKQEQLRQFDLKTPPLMAIALIQISDTSWRLVWTMHHLISDGWSTEVALKDVFNRYNNAPPLGPLPPSFKSYLIWLRKQSPLTDHEFWTEQFSGLDAPSLLPEPGDTRVGTLQQSRSDLLGADLLERVEQIAARLKMTTNTVLSAAWALVLRRMLGQDDVVFGTVTAGRPADIAGIGDAVGAFVNTLPVRLTIDPEQPVDALLHTHARSENARRRHEFASLPEVQACAPFPAGTPLFDALFVNEGVANVSLEFGNIRLSDLRTSQFSNYPLALLVTPQGSFKAEIYFDPAKISGEKVETCLDSYKQVLIKLSGNPEIRIKDLFQSAQSFATTAPAPDNETVVQRFLQQAGTNPNAPALSDENGTLTYSDLSYRARQIAHALRAKGVGPSDIIPVALPRGADSVAAFLGVMMCGAAYVPLDLTYPAQRIAQIFDVVSPRLFVTQSDCEMDVSETAAQAVLVDNLQVAIDPASATTGERAYVMFTSGSQNRPKGVEITQTGLAVSTAARDIVHGAPPEAYLLLSSLAFDSSVAGIYWTLCSGGHLVIAARRAEQEPLQLGKLIRQHQITHTLCLPSLAQALLLTVPKQDLQSLRMLIAAGEAVPTELIAQCQAALPLCRLINEYGPTEATVWCTSFDATGFDGSHVPIGSPIPGTWVGIVDPDDCQAEPGDVGEIVVAGKTVAQGYLNDPRQTAERFFSMGPDALPAYRTGDLGVADAAGCITFLGRKDKQVKIRGHRIELSELETVARSVAENTRVAALITETDGMRAITLALECRDGDALCERVRSEIEATLPAPFHPKSVEAVAEFPNLPNGKLDERALATLLAERMTSKDNVPLRDDLETRIAALFADVLKVTCTSRDDNFFEMGGDSLMTLKTSARAREGGLRFEPMDLFSFPTVGGLADHLRALQQGDVDQTRWKVFRTANERGQETPVALVHCLMPFFNHVAEHLGPDHTVVHMPGHRLPGMPVPFDKSLEDLADEAIATLRDVAPDRPILLCGFSAGCALVLAIAKQLGPENVAGIVLLDPPYKMIGAEPALQPLYYRTYKRWRYQFRRAKHRRKAQVAVPEAKAQLDNPNCTEDQRIDAVSLTYGLAINDYHVQRVDHPTRVFLTPGNPAMTKGDVLDTHLTNKRIHQVETKHRQLLRETESQARIAACIKSLIDKSAESLG